MSTGKAQDRLDKLKSRLKTERTSGSGRPEKIGVKSAVVKPRKKERNYQENTSDEKKKKIKELINHALAKPASSTQVKEPIRTRTSAQVSVVTPLPASSVRSTAQSRLKRATHKKDETNVSSPQTKSSYCSTTQKPTTAAEMPSSHLPSKYRIPKKAGLQDYCRPPSEPAKPPQNVCQVLGKPAWHDPPVPADKTAPRVADKADTLARAANPYLRPSIPLPPPKASNPPPEVQRNLFQRKTAQSSDAKNTVKPHPVSCGEDKTRNRPYQRPQQKPKQDNGPSSKSLGWGEWVSKTCRDVVDAVKGSISSYSLSCPNVTKQLQNVRVLVEPVEMMDYEISCPLFESQLAPTDQTDLHIVIDTNVVLDNLNLIRSLKFREVKGLKPKIIIPWQVLKELDYLKENKAKFDSMHTNVSARKGIRFLLDEIVRGDGFIGGQPQQAASRDSNNFIVEVPDDHLIKCCLQLKWAGHNVLLLTNDKNLVIKAVVSEVSSMRCDEFSKICHESGVNDRPLSCFEEPPPSGAFTGHKLNDVTATHRVIILLRGFLSAVLKKFWIYKYQDLWKLRSPGQEPRSLTTLLEIAYETWSEIVCSQSHSSSEVFLFLRRFINKMSYERLVFQDLDQLGRACHQLANSLPSSFGVEGITFDHSLAFLKCTDDSGPPADATFLDSCVSLTVHHFQLFENKVVQYCYGLSQNHGVPFNYPKIPPDYQRDANINNISSHIRVVSDIGRALVRVSASPIGEISRSSEAAQTIHSALTMYLGEAADHRFVLQDAVEFCNSSNMRKSFTGALENLETISTFLQSFSRR